MVLLVLTTLFKWLKSIDQLRPLNIKLHNQHYWPIFFFSDFVFCYQQTNTCSCVLPFELQSFYVNQSRSVIKTTGAAESHEYFLTKWALPNRSCTAVLAAELHAGEQASYSTISTNISKVSRLRGMSFCFATELTRSLIQCCLG